MLGGMHEAVSDSRLKSGLFVVDANVGYHNQGFDFTEHSYSAAYRCRDRQPHGVEGLAFATKMQARGPLMSPKMR